jgi:transcriptional regulator with XRE-family HTH domain
MSDLTEEEYNELPLAATIKRLRQDAGLTQVDFAAGLKITPASVYRYEAATTRPSRQTLAKLHRFAIEHNDYSAERIFSRALHGVFRSSGTGKEIELFYGLSNPAFEIFQAHARTLSDQDLITVLALIQLLADRKQPNQTVFNALRALLQPYMGQAEKDLKGVLSDQPDPKGAESEEAKRKPQN